MQISSSSSIQVDAALKAKTVCNYISVFLANFCAMSAGYFGLRTDFAMPINLYVALMFFTIWLIITVVAHTLLKPYLTRRFIAKSAGQ